MKVALVTQPYDDVLPPRQNSIGLILYNTARELARSANVTVYMKRAAEEGSGSRYPFGIRSIETAVDDALIAAATKYPRWSSRFGLAKLADRFPQYVRRITAELGRDDPAVVHVMNYWWWCRRLKGGSRTRKVVLEMQAEWLSQMDTGEVQRQLQHIDAVATVSDHVGDLFKKAFPGYAGIVATVYNGVDVDVFRPDERPRTDSARSILFVGRTSPEKGVHTLIEAFATVAKEHGDARLDIAGPRATLPSRYLVDISDDPVVQRLAAFYDGSVASDYQAYLDDLVAKLDLNGRVRFHGSLPHHDLVELYRQADVLCNPSFSESFGISIVEAMACGKPAVGTRIGGMKETIVPGETGFAVEPDSPDELADALCRILGDRGLAAGMGANGRSRALSHFTWRARAERLLRIYECCAASG